MNAEREGQVANESSNRGAECKSSLRVFFMFVKDFLENDPEKHKGRIRDYTIKMDKKQGRSKVIPVDDVSSVGQAGIAEGANGDNGKAYTVTEEDMKEAQEGLEIRKYGLDIRYLLEFKVVVAWTQFYSQHCSSSNSVRNYAKFIQEFYKYLLVSEEPTPLEH